MKFEWDETKNQKNIQNRKISFAYATQIFLDDNRIDTLDTRKDYGEQRRITMGSISNRVFVVIECNQNGSKLS